MLDLNAKKVIHSNRLKNWNTILIQIEDWIATKDYHEFVLIFNDPKFNSSYFEGYSALVNKFKRLMEKDDLEALYKFISTTTKKDIDKIKVDFSI